MTDFVIADGAELPPNERLIVEIEGKEIAVFNIDGEFYAYLNRCPHQYGPVCEGKLTGTWVSRIVRGSSPQENVARDSVEWGNRGRVLNCPWHGWEFDITSGQCLSYDRANLQSIEVTVQEGKVILEL